MRYRLSNIVLLVIVIAVIAVGYPVRAQQQAMMPVQAGLRFVENRGQVADMEGKPRPDILYTAESNGVRLYFRRNGISYVFMRFGSDSSTELSEASIFHPDPTRFKPSRPRDVVRALYRMDMDLVGANAGAIITADDPQGDYSNFYYRHCPQGITHVPGFATLIYHDIYPHIDLIFHISGTDIKYNILVRPGGTVEDIRLRYSGADSMRMIGDGSIRIVNPFGQLTEGAPVMRYDDIPYDRNPGLGIHYRLVGDEIRFAAAEHDATRPLMIDPLLEWSTYFGHETALVANPSAVITEYPQYAVRDASGNIIADGFSTLTSFPTSTGAFQSTFGGTRDLIVVKLSGTGGRLWATYYGGSGNEYNEGLAVDRNNAVFVAGVNVGGGLPVLSTAFQTSNAGVEDIFVVKFDSVGNRIWDTYYGGPAYELQAGLAVDSSNNLIISGITSSSSPSLATSGAFQTSNAGGYDAFITKFSGSGRQLWSTYLGGSGNEYFSVNCGVGPDGTIYAVGTTPSMNFPVTSGAFQSSVTDTGAVLNAFVTAIDSSGSRLLWSTYLGGSASDMGCALSVDGRDAVYITGCTGSTDFPVTSGAFQTSYGGGILDAFLVKLNTSGQRLWGTYLGGSSADFLSPVSVDVAHSIVVGGFTGSSNFPITSDALQTAKRPDSDAVLCKFDPAGSYIWGTFFGGDFADRATGVACYAASIFLTGFTNSGNIPITSGAFQSAGPGLFVAKFCSPKFSLPISGSRSICQGDTMILAVPDGFTALQWSNGATSRSIAVTQPGQFWLTATDGVCSVRSDTAFITVNPRPSPVISASGPLMLCEGDSVVLDAGVGYGSYRWSSGDSISRVVVKRSGIYSVTVTNSFGCSATSRSVQVVVNPRPTATITVKGATTFCEGDSVTLIASPSGNQYLWSTGATTPSITVGATGLYGLIVSNTFNCSTAATPVAVTVHPSPSARIVAVTATSFCKGDSAILQAAAVGVRYHWSTGDTGRRIVVYGSGSYALTVTDSNGCSATSPPTMVQVSEIPHPSIIADGPLRFCQGDSVTLDAGDNFASYVWSNGYGSRRILVRESGRYAVSVTNDVGCGSTSDTVVVRVDPRPRIAISGPSSVCANAVAVYGTAAGSGISYLWSITGNGTITGDPRSNSIAVRWGTSGGTLHLHATLDSSGCSTDTVLTVGVGSGLVPEVTSDRGLKLCQGDSVTLDAGSYNSYRWSTGDTTRTITVRVAGIYTVTVSDANGCGGTSKPVTVSITPDPKPVVVSSRGRSICAGDSTVLDAGGGYARYEWSNGYTTRYLTARSGGVYSVRVTDSAGCDGTSEPVEVMLLPAPDVAMHGPVLVCRNSTVSYATDAMAGTAYTWTVTGGTITAGQGGSTISVQWGAGPAGTVMLSERTSGGCVGSTSIAVAIGDRLEPVITPNGPVALCEGSTVKLDAGSGYTSYQWSDGEQTETIEVGIGGTYSVTVSDANGCTGESQPMTVTVSPKPFAAVTPSGPITLCEGDSVTLTASPGFASYHWSSGETVPAIVVRTSGSYGVTVTSSEGCSSASPAVTVSVVPAPAKPEITAIGDTLTSSVAENYQWNVDGRMIAGAVGRSYVADRPGRYTVTIGDGSCSSTSDAWARVGQPVAWLDTASGAVGDRLRLHLLLRPALDGSEQATGYRVRLKLPTKALFPHGVIDDRVGNPVRVTYQSDGTLEIERDGLQSPALGGELFELEVEGLTTAEPLNAIGVGRVELIGVGALPVIGEGLVILSGCDVGRNFAYGKRASIVSVLPNPVRNEATVTYHAPSGARPTLRLYDVAGEEVLSVPVPAGTGDEQSIQVRTDGVASGFYRLDLRNGDETSSVALFIRK